MRYRGGDQVPAGFVICFSLSRVLPSATYPGTALRLALNAAVPAGTALIGSYWYGSKLDTKGALRFDVSNGVADAFFRNQSWIRAELRCYLAILRPLSIGKVTALPGA